MLAIERRRKILAQLKRDKKVIVSVLANEYHVTEETIRRDLEKLAQEGIAVKSYGGAVLKESNNEDLPFWIRRKENIKEKTAIAAETVKLIPEGASLMLDSSSTSGFVARELKEIKGLTMITTSVEIVAECTDWSEKRVISAGGEIRQGSCTMAGIQTEEVLKKYCVDFAVISCQGIHRNFGLTETEEAYARNKKTMLEQAGQRILVADHSKFGKHALTVVSDFSDVDFIVTDLKPDEEWMDFLENRGIICIYPENSMSDIL